MGIVVRVGLVFALVIAGLVWSAYLALFKKDVAKAKEIASLTLFFGIIWGLFYWFIIK
jgi:hypothetical protein